MFIPEFFLKETVNISISCDELWHEICILIILIHWSEVWILVILTKFSLLSHVSAPEVVILETSVGTPLLTQMIVESETREAPELLLLTMISFWIPAWISIHMPSKVGDEITYPVHPVQNFNRHHEKFWAFTGQRIDFGLILLISNMIIHRSFTGPTHLLSANVQGPVSYVVSASTVTFGNR